MYRVEIIANHSIQDELIEKLEKKIDQFFYSIIPTIHGRGKQKRKLGSSTWPEENFILISYVEKKALTIIQDEITRFKEKFPTEGIKIFVIS